MTYHGIKTKYLLYFFLDKKISDNIMVLPSILALKSKYYGVNGHAYSDESSDNTDSTLQEEVDDSDEVDDSNEVDDSDDDDVYSIKSSDSGSPEEIEFLSKKLLKIARDLSTAELNLTVCTVLNKILLGDICSLRTAIINCNSNNRHNTPF